MTSKDIHNYTFGGWSHMPWKPTRDFIFIDQYLDELAEDFYPQPPDDGHTALAVEVIDKWIPEIKPKNVLDVGCGEGFCQGHFERHGLYYRGICLGEDFEKAREL